MSMFAENDPFNSIVENLGLDSESLGYVHRPKDGQMILIGTAEGEEMRQALLEGYAVAKADLRLTDLQPGTEEYGTAIGRGMFDAVSNEETALSWQSELCVFGNGAITKLDDDKREPFQLDESLSLFGTIHGVMNGQFFNRHPSGRYALSIGGLLVLSSVVVCENSGYGQVDTQFEFAEVPIHIPQLHFGAVY
ncbi:MAG TPA: hypothetical protein PLT04_02150 [Candidatus Saccharibacteria bacterium]|nr:hypothetical protein [Candidatus Saccharibacteria bacterium]